MRNPGLSNTVARSTRQNVRIYGLVDMAELWVGKFSMIIFFTRWHGRKGILHPSQRLPVPRSQGELSDVAASIFTTEVNVLQPPAAIKRGGIDTREA
jgi:hypothetical protein